MTDAAETITLDEAIARIRAVSSLTEADVLGIRAVAEVDPIGTRVALILQSYIDAGAVRDVSVWETILSILKLCADVASALIPIGNAIGIVKGLVA